MKSESTKKKPPNKLKIWLDQHGLTVSQFAQETGIPEFVINKWINKKLQARNKQGMNIIKARGEAFKTWLKTKKLSYSKFSRVISVPYGTVPRWGEGVGPRPTSLELIKLKFPDCPLTWEKWD